MERTDFLNMMDQFHDSIKDLKNEKDFYEFEKKFEEAWLQTGRALMEKVISEPGNDRRKKKKL
jgi:hypothetical protein